MKNNINQTGQIVALLSFVIGTILLAFYLYFGEEVINVFAAFFFVVGALIANTVLITVIIGRAILYSQHRLKSLKTIALMLINIPISILYFYMVVTFPGHKFLL